VTGRPMASDQLRPKRDSYNVSLKLRSGEIEAWRGWTGSFFHDIFSGRFDSWSR
jgi:hypothetical protein